MVAMARAHLSARPGKLLEVAPLMAPWSELAQALLAQLAGIAATPVEAALHMATHAAESASGNVRECLSYH